jgi:L-ribulose-5-phosphate 4-epimerase
MPQVSNQLLKERLFRAAQYLFMMGVMSPNGHGNISVRLPDEHMLLVSADSPGVPEEEKFVTVTFDGDVIDGPPGPNVREMVAMHAAIYRTRKEAGAVIHSHSPQVTAFALAHKPLPCAYEAFLRFGITEDIPVADWAPRGSRESITNILDQMAKHPTVPAILLGNHGLVAFGRDLILTAKMVAVMEEAATLMLLAQSLGGPKPFPADALERERAHIRQFGSSR